MSESKDECRTVEVDGELVRVRGGAPLNDEAQTALASVVAAAKRRMSAEPPGPLQFACPACSAKPGGFCHRPDGIVTAPHQERRAFAGEVTEDV